MLKNILKVPLNYLGRCFNLTLALPMSVAFAVTYKCNSHCKTCNIWKDTLDIIELNLSEINCLFRSLGKCIGWITLNGGEPFLRSDLADICQIIYQNCQPTVINIPTNGSLPERIIDCVKKILKDCPKTKLIINLSVDGIGEKHDVIRGLLGNFDNIIKTYRGLRGIGNPRLRLGINTVISEYNINDWEIIYTYIDKLQPDSHLFEIAQLRDEFRNRGNHHIIPSKEYSTLLFKKLLHLIQINKRTLMGRCLHAIRKNYYSLIEKTIMLGHRVIPCFAGIATAYILPDGKVWTCCNNAWLMGDLKEYNFDFRKLWQGKTAQDIRRRIKMQKCFCIQVNTNYLNLLHSPAYFGRLIYDALF